MILGLVNSLVNPMVSGLVGGGSPYPSSPFFNIDFSNASSLEIIDGKVSKVFDSSGSGRFFSQNDVLTRPVMYDDKWCTFSSNWLQTDNGSENLDFTVHLTAVVTETWDIIHYLWGRSTNNGNGLYAEFSYEGDRCGFVGNTGNSVLGPNLPENTVYHLTGRQQGGILSLFVNGVLVGSNTGTFVSSIRQYLGRNGQGFRFYGRIGQMFYYDRPLSDEEIAQLYDYTNEKFFSPA